MERQSSGSEPGQLPQHFPARDPQLGDLVCLFVLCFYSVYIVSLICVLIVVVLWFYYVYIVSLFSVLIVVVLCFYFPCIVVLLCLYCGFIVFMLYLYCGFIVFVLWFYSVCIVDLFCLYSRFRFKTFNLSLWSNRLCHSINYIVFPAYSIILFINISLYIIIFHF